MRPIPERIRAERRTVIDAVLVLMVIVLMTQMWLLTAALEAYLGGHLETALPGMGVSAVLFAVCVGLYRFVAGVDKS